MSPKIEIPNKKKKKKETLSAAKRKENPFKLVFYNHPYFGWDLFSHKDPTSNPPFIEIKSES